LNKQLFTLAKEQSECSTLLIADPSTPRNYADPFWPAGPLVFDILRSIYLGCMVIIFIASLGNRPEASKFLYYAIAIIFALIMGVMLFMGGWTIKISIDAYNEYLSANRDISGLGGFFHYARTTPAFRDLVISTLSTYGLYLIGSLIHLDPWHIFTCMIQYLFMIPSFVNILMVYAFTNIHVSGRFFIIITKCWHCILTFSTNMCPHVFHVVYDLCINIGRIVSCLILSTMML
jgi:cellulose synthase/poly-beta-1,6-N-acetylglucosamine synthase-like glycosyltransferase